MKIWNIVKHILVVGIFIIVVLGIPLVTSDRFREWAGLGLDATSGATQEIDEPSGNYTVLINRELHRDTDKLRTWIDFFSGREIGVIFEDITCMVAATDVTALEMADSLRSRLPENQMVIDPEDVTLMLSKADIGRYDVIVMSDEMYEAYHADSVADQTDAEVVHISNTNY